MIVHRPIVNIKHGVHECMQFSVYDIGSSVYVSISSDGKRQYFVVLNSNLFINFLAASEWHKYFSNSAISANSSFCESLFVLDLQDENAIGITLILTF